MKELLITLDNKQKTPLYRQIYQFIRDEIRKGNIPAGERLPSSRLLARQLSVSRSTVDLAYDQLTAEGYLEAVPWKGYFVGDATELYQLGALQKPQPRQKAPEAPACPLDFALNGIAPGSFPQNSWRKLSRQVLAADDGSLFQLGDEKGQWELREAIAAYLHHARGVNCDPDQIVIGAGNDYLLMLLSAILGKKTRIAIENPTYLSAYRCFVSLGHDVTAISQDEEGMRPDELEQSGAEAAYVMPAHQFPTGRVMPIRRRNQLLAWAAQRETRFLIEDDYDSEFRYKGKPIPALQGADTRDKVIYLGTFSKSVAPAIRISYMVLPERLLPVYEERGRCFSATVSRVDQKILELFLRDGYFERHLNRMRNVYRARHDLLLRELRPLQKICSITGENAGVHLLLQFQNGMSETDAVARAADIGIRVYGLQEFSVPGAEVLPGSTVLLGFATLTEEQLIRGCEQLRAVWMEPGEAAPSSE